MSPITIGLGVALLLTIVLLIRSLFRQAGIQDTLKETSDSAHDQLKLWEEFGQHLDEGVALIDQHEVIVYANGAFADLTGWGGRSSFNQPLNTILQIQDEDGQSVSLPSTANKTPSYVVTKDAGRTPVHPVRRPLHKPEGYSVVVLRDASAEYAEKELRHRLVNLSSFELRAPVTAMKGYASMLLEGDAGKLPQEAVDYVKPILDSTDKLLMIIDDMAHVEALSDSRQASKKESIQLEALMKQIAKPLQKAASEADRKLVANQGPGGISLTVDPTQISRLMTMLASTAVRTAKPKSEITLSAAASPQSVEIILENQGEPLSKESQANVFDYVGGHGLDEGIGFYVAKQIIESHRASVSVNTKSEGNVFVLSLPRPTESAKPAASKKSAPAKSGDGTVDALKKPKP